MRHELLDLAANLDRIIRDHLAKISGYEPSHGRNKKERVPKDKLRELFSHDPLYSIFGLDSPEYVSATLGGGTVTSIHRKIGDLYEECVREIVKASLSLKPAEVRYVGHIASGAQLIDRSLDCFIPLDRLPGPEEKRLRSLAGAGFQSLAPKPTVRVVGIGFEVRHCYQSADSRRAQADDAMAMQCGVSGILPVMLVFCNQSNRQILRRYTRIWYVTEGMDSYNMVKEISGFDFYGFLLAHREEYRKPVIDALRRIQQVE
ncbi:MAG TPA: hypothetical protein VMT20_04645 [Terriglobia bacterium]|nr:hypothetical protein [Terriglobia bacterium]